MNRGPKAARVSYTYLPQFSSSSQIYAETRKEIAPDAQPQEVYVLREGFSGFQARYRVSLAQQPEVWLMSRGILN